MSAKVALCIKGYYNKTSDFRLLCSILIFILHVAASIPEAMSVSALSIATGSEFEQFLFGEEEEEEKEEGDVMSNEEEQDKESITVI